jgi:hypothetical protein
MRLKGILSLIFSLPIFIPFNITSAQPLQFSKEYIEIRISEDYSFINGAYTFSNNSNDIITRTLFYPFPVSKTNSYPDSIFVFNKDNKEIPFAKSSSGIYFTIEALPHSETVIKVLYVQKLFSDEMKYILTSTQQWIQPLQTAEYKILLPKEFELKSISLNPFNKVHDPVYNIYYIIKENYMPETDLFVSWIRRKK